jgi:hypothetical protein
MDLTNILFQGNAVERAFPIFIEEHFTPQRAPDMWFGDELPPTYQDYLNSPEVKQAKAFVAFQILQCLAEVEQRNALANASPKQRKAYAKQFANAMRQKAGAT